jgi:phage terminase large subunit
MSGLFIGNTPWYVPWKIKVVAYYEAQGQDLATHVNWLRQAGYGKAECFLPHDGASNEKVFDVSYESALRQAGFSVRVVPNQGKGAAMQRVEAGRRWFPRIWFNEATCAAGLDALGAYHERKDEVRGVGLGPNHDWSSHGADSFGLMCATYEPPRSTTSKMIMPKLGIV